MLMLMLLLSLLGADKRTLIPIKYRHCDIPLILRHIAMLDYTRQDTKPWFWRRLASTLRTATPQTAILQPFAFGPGYHPAPLTRSLSSTELIDLFASPAQPPPFYLFDETDPAPAAAATMALPAAELPAEQFALEMRRMQSARLAEEEEEEDTRQPVEEPTPPPPQQQQRQHRRDDQTMAATAPRSPSKRSKWLSSPTSFGMNLSSIVKSSKRK